ncbi:hypothetical protein T439DRAFT_381685 [Meredithblackwellia eburnea MCA 4105]
MVKPPKSNAIWPTRRRSTSTKTDDQEQQQYTTASKPPQHIQKAQRDYQSTEKQFYDQLKLELLAAGLSEDEVLRGMPLAPPPPPLRIAFSKEGKVQVIKQEKKNEKPPIMRRALISLVAKFSGSPSEGGKKKRSAKPSKTLINSLETAISQRVVVAKYFLKEHSHFDQSNHGHIHWIKFLENLLDRLSPSPKRRKQSIELAPVDHLTASMNNLGLNDEDDTDADSIFAITPTVQPSILTFFVTLQSLLDQIQTSWTSYAEGKSSLLTAALITSQALEIAESLENKLYSRYPESLSGKKGHEGLLMMMAKGEGFEDMVKGIGGRESPFAALAGLHVLEVLKQVAQEMDSSIDVAPSKSHADGLPFSTRSSRAAEIAQDVALLRTMLPEVIRVSLHHYSSASMFNEALYRDTRVYAVKSSHPIPTHLVFQWMAWLEIVKICGTGARDLGNPARVALRTAEKVKDSAIDWLRVALRTPSVGIEECEWVEDELVQPIRRELERCEEVKGELRKWGGLKEEGQGGVLERNPWAAGCLQLSILSTSLSVGARITNRNGNLGPQLQLYYALRKYKFIRAREVYEDVLDLSVDKLIPSSDLPERGKIGRTLWGRVERQDEVEDERHSDSGYGSGWESDDGEACGKNEDIKASEKAIKRRDVAVDVMSPGYASSLVADLRMGMGFHLDWKLVLDILDHRRYRAARGQTKKKPLGTSVVDGDVVDVSTLLECLHKRSEEELTNGSLGLDLFTLDRISMLTPKLFAAKVGSTIHHSKAEWYTNNPDLMPRWVISSYERDFSWANRRWLKKNVAEVLLEQAATAFTETNAKEHLRFC